MYDDLLKNDPLKQFDWNNKKAMPKKRLHKEFIKLLSSEHRVRVFRHLIEKRREVLKEECKAYNERVNEEKRQKVVETVISFYNAKLNIHLDVHIARSFNELALVHTIMFQEPIIEPETNQHGYNRGKEKKSHDEAIVNVIEKLEERNKRLRHFSPDPLIEELKNMEFVSHQTYREPNKNRKAMWDKMEKVALLDEARAKKIVKACLAQKKVLEKLSEKKKKSINLELKRIDTFFRSKADGYLQEIYFRALQIRLNAEDRAFLD